MEARFIAPIECNPPRVLAARIVRKNSFKSLRGRSGFGQQLGPQRAIGSEHALLHPHRPHLLQNPRRLRLIRPQHNAIHPRPLDDPQLPRKIRVARHVLLLDRHRMSKPHRCIAKFGNAHPAIAIVHPQQRHALEAEFGVDVTRQRESLHPVVLQIGEVPRNVRLGNGGIGRCGVDDGNLGFQRHAQHDVRRLRVDRSKDRPVLVVIDHLHRFIRRRAPDGRVGRPNRTVRRLCLPVVVVVVQHQPERLAPVTAARVGLFHRQLRAVQHPQAGHLVRAVLNGPDEPDAHLRQVLGIGNTPPRAGVNIGMGVVEIVGLGELLEGTHVRRFARIRLHYTVLGRPRRMRAT